MRGQLRGEEDYCFVDLGTPEGRGGWAYGINDWGQIVGWAYHSYDIRYRSRRAFLWSDGTMMNLATPSGGEWFFVVAHDINSSGQVVGSSLRREGLSRHAYPVLWTPNAKARLEASEEDHPSAPTVEDSGEGDGE